MKTYIFPAVERTRLENEDNVCQVICKGVKERIFQSLAVLDKYN